METRTYKGEIRAEQENIIEGIASSVNSRYDLGWFEEEIAPGAFDDSLKDDVRVLFNHDPNLILGRTAAGTAEIFTLEDGSLGYRYESPNTTIANDLKENIRLGNVNQSSFAFTVREEKWVWAENRSDSNKDLRIITKIDRLFDVSPVTYPANPNTYVGERGVDIEEIHKRALETREAEKRSEDKEGETSKDNDGSQAVFTDRLKRKLTMYKF